MSKRSQYVALTAAMWMMVLAVAESPAQNRYATSDNMSGYVHWIDLYDANNNRIDPTAENPQPYSPEKTCGRCHDFDAISHGWHFDATDPEALHGRPGQPWIWSDARTGTHLPLSYRGWPGTHNPDVLGLSRWQVAAKLGGFLPGGGPGSVRGLQTKVDHPQAEDRSSITGPLPVDCLLCHRNEGSGYSPFVWTEQIADQNFAYAPTAALGLAEISGSMARLKEFDPAAADASSKLPQVKYDLDRFRSDGKVFIDLVRKPQNNACYYCHTNVAAASINGERWLHDEDVHLRAGMSCADCHRNGLDHQTVRGFEKEKHPAGTSIASLSCQGCHIGAPDNQNPLAEAGRMGAPRPAHWGIPSLHFDIMSCTSCHAGPAPSQAVGRQVNSIAHRLGEHVKRSGQEFPAIVGPVNLQVAYTPATEEAEGDEPDDSPKKKFTPHRLMWPSYWATRQDDKVTPVQPELVYETVRRPLKVRRDFTAELAEVSLSLTERKELLGEDRARVKDDERTPEEQKKVAEAEAKARKLQIDERMNQALAALEEEFPGAQAVFITGGSAFVRDGEAAIKRLPDDEIPAATAPYAWPLAHNVRPARQSLGATGCIECHSENALFFGADITPVGLLPGQATTAFKTHQLQDVDQSQLKNWNRLFAGRALFKIASLVALALTCLIAMAAAVSNLRSFWRHSA